MFNIVWLEKVRKVCTNTFQHLSMEASITTQEKKQMESKEKRTMKEVKLVQTEIPI